MVFTTRFLAAISSLKSSQQPVFSPSTQPDNFKLFSTFWRFLQYGVMFVSPISESKMNLRSLELKDH